MWHIGKIEQNLFKKNDTFPLNGTTLILYAYLPTKIISLEKKFITYNHLPINKVIYQTYIIKFHSRITYARTD